MTIINNITNREVNVNNLYINPFYPRIPKSIRDSHPTEV